MQAATPFLCTESDAFSVSGSSPPSSASSHPCGSASERTIRPRGHRPQPVASTTASTDAFIVHDERKQTLHFPHGFVLERSLPLDSLTLAYHLVGPADAPVVVVLGGISSTRHVATDDHGGQRGWWSDLVGPGRAIDTHRVRVLSIDYLGGHGDTRFAEPSPVTITTADQARALAYTLDQLGIEHVALFVGASYGAMVGLSLAAALSHRIGHLVAISGAHRSHPIATAWRSVQRNIVRMGLDHGAAAEGLALARALAMTTYRSSAEFDKRFAGTPCEVSGRLQFPVERYLEQRGAEFCRRFTPQAYLTLSESIDLHTVDPQAIHCRSTIVGVSSDVLVPPAHSRELASSMAGPSAYVELESLYGHDAFLKETTALAETLSGALSARGGVG